MLKLNRLHIVLIAWILIWTALQLMPLPQTLKLAVYLQDHRPSWLPVGVDKLIHFLGYASWSLLGVLAFRTFTALAAFTLTFLVGALHGLVVELMQAALTFRMGDPLDWTADLIGLVFGGLLAIVIRQAFYRPAQVQEEKGMPASECH